MKRPKITPIIITSRESLNSHTADYVHSKIEHAQAVAAMELDIATVQKNHQEAILEIERKIEAEELGIQMYCEAHRDELFPENKSLDTLVATIGFRFTPYKVEKRSGIKNFEIIAKRLEALDWGEPFIRYPEPTLNKDALLAVRGVLTNEKLQQAGIMFTRDENFYIDPKSDVAADVVKPASAAA